MFQGITNPTPFIDTLNYTDDDDDVNYDSYDVTSGDESLLVNSFHRDFIPKPSTVDSSTCFTPDFDQSSGKDSAVASESESKKSSDMSENLSVSNSSDSEREFMRSLIKKSDSRDIGYGSESLSDEMTFPSRSTRNRKSVANQYYATVAVDTSGSGSTDKGEADLKSEESDINSQVENVLRQEEPQIEDIHFLINQADLMVQQGNTFNKNFSAEKKEPSEPQPAQSPAFAREMVDKGVGSTESCCEASDEDSGDSDGPHDETETIDSILGSEYTSDEMKATRDNMRLPKLCDITSVRSRVKGQLRQDRPWSVIEVPSAEETRHVSAVDCPLDKMNSAFSDSDIPSNQSRKAKSLSPSLPRHKVRRLHRISVSSSSTARSQLGAKRKLDLNLSGTQNAYNSDSNSSCYQISTKNAVSVPEISHSQMEPVHFNKITSKCISGDQSMEDPDLTPVKSPVSGPLDVPCNESCLSEDEVTSPSGHSDLISTLQNARFRSSGSSHDDSDTQGKDMNLELYFICTT